MNNYMISTPMRFFFLFSGTVIWLGIWLTGFKYANWLLYVPAVLFYFAAVTRICPGLVLSRIVFKE